MESIIDILMRRDRMTYDDAVDAVNDAKLAVKAGENPEEVLEEHFGLEPDYLFEII